MNEGFLGKIAFVLIILIGLSLAFQMLGSSSSKITSEQVDWWLIENNYVAYGSSPGLTYGQVPYATGANNLAGEGVFTYNPVTNILTVPSVNGTSSNSTYAAIAGDTALVNGYQGVRTATYVVAASDAPAHVKSQADYVCDGIADNVQIQAAIDALTAGRTWKETIKCVGKFYISAKVMPSSYSILDLTGAELYLNNNVNSYVLHIQAKQYVDVVGGVLDGNKANNTGSSSCIYVSGGSSYCHLLNVTAKNGALHGISFNNNCVDNLIDGCLTIDNTDMGFIVSVGDSRNHFSNCTDVGAGEASFRVWSDNGTLCYDNIFTNCISLNAVADGFTFATGGRNKFLGCIAINAGSDGFHSYTFSGTTASGNIISDCLAYNCAIGFTISAYTELENCKSYNSISTGFYVTTVGSMLNNCTAENGTISGFDIRSPSYLYNCKAINNGQGAGGASNQAGFKTATLGTVYFSGCLALDNQGVATQTSGFRIGISSSIKDCIIIGSTTPISDPSSLAVKVRNVGYVTENSGTATITAAETSIVVTHGLAVTPDINKIRVNLQITTTNDIGYWYVDTITSTQFTIHVLNAPGASTAIFGWSYQN
jgi:hypothetical protein